MWVAKFTLKDYDDIYTPLNNKYKIDFFATPYTHYKKDGLIHVFVGGILVGTEKSKQSYVEELRKDNRIHSVEVSKDYIFIIFNQYIGMINKI